MDNKGVPRAAATWDTGEADELRADALEKVYAIILAAAARQPTRPAPREEEPCVA